MFFKNLKQIFTPKGLRPLLSINNVSEKVEKYDRSLTFVEALSDEMLKFQCDHLGAKKIEIILYGESIFRGETKDARPQLCPNCILEEIKQFSIRCAFCGGAILPGEGVALYNKESEGINKKWGTYVGENIIGCLAMDCCPSGGFFAGHWTMQGFKPAFKNGLSLAEEAARTGSIKIANP